MALTKNDLDELDQAIACAELTVTIDGRTVTYRSIDELMKARRHVANVLARRSGRRHPLGDIVVTVLDRGIR